MIYFEFEGGEGSKNTYILMYFVNMQKKSIFKIEGVARNEFSNSRKIKK